MGRIPVFTHTIHSYINSHNFFSCDEKSQDYSCDKCVSCDFTRENFLRVMTNYAIFMWVNVGGNEAIFIENTDFFPRPKFH